MAQYKLITATNQVKPSMGKLKGFFCSIASGSPTVVVYDSDTTGTGTKIIDTFTPVAGTVYSLPADGLLFNNGLYIVIANTVSLTVIFE